VNKPSLSLESVQVHPPDPGPSLPLLFASFLRMGVTAFGGPAMIAYLRKLVVSQKKWLDAGTFQDGVALCQTIPGATVMQMAAYIGLQVQGVRGALICYVGFGLPAFLLMVVLSSVYARTNELPTVVAIFSGLQAVVVAIVANATVSFGKTTLKNWRRVAIALVAAGLFGFMANPILIILIAGFLGALLNGRLPVARSAAQSAKMRHTTIPLLLFFLASTAGFSLLFLYRTELFQLAVLMSKIDLIAFGGGFASVPLMFHEIVESRSWMDASTFLNGIILGQFTPGPIVITATFVGYMVDGLLGSLVATVAIFLPSFLILIGVAPWFDRLRSNPVFTRVISGILCSFVGLLFTVTIRFALQVHWDWPHLALLAAALAALLLKVDILWVVLAGTAISAFAI
jgi:chromate transporter